MESCNVSQWRSMVSRQNPELLRKAQEELQEKPETRDQDIQKLREMVLAEEDLTSPTDDAFLLRFLRARKFNHERAFKMLQRYFSIRLKHPGIFAAYRPSSIRHVLNQHAHIVLPNRDRLGRKIYVVRMGRWEPELATVDEMCRMMHMCVELAIADEETQVHGVVIIYDMKYFGLQQAKWITPMAAKKAVSLIQDCLPARFKGFHVIFEPAIFDAVYQIVKPFLTKKTKSRIYLHGHILETLHKHVDPACLPEDYGGLLPLMDCTSTASSMLKKDDEIAASVANSGYRKRN